MQPLYSVTEIRAIEHAAARALPPGALMARAGEAAATVALDLLAPAAQGASVLVLAGPGNNGGDALEVAARLARAGAQVTVLHHRPAGAPSAERAIAWQRAGASAARIIDVGQDGDGQAAVAIGAGASGAVVAVMTGAVVTDTEAPGAVTTGAVVTGAVVADTEVTGTMVTGAAVTGAVVADTEVSGAVAPGTVVAGTAWRLVVDGLFGIGLRRPLGGAMAALVNAVNRCDCPVLALDVPSGLNADTGAVIGANGADSVAIEASHTVTFIGNKPGLHTNAGRDHAGIVTLATLAIDPSLYPATRVHLNAVDLFGQHVHARRHNSNKGSYGNVAVIGGARGMAGAPILAARAALHCGAGRVYVLYLEHALAADSGQPELMCRLAEGYDLERATLVIGPGLGSSSAAVDLLARAIASDSALLADADALNLIAADPALQAALARRPRPAVLTPHPLEAARLLGADATVAQVQADRVATARTLAARYHAYVVLKGSGTVIASPDGNCVINTTGNPALATAGTGDVLSGVCGSLLAQGWPQWQAALAAVWLHGAAADTLVASGIGPIGLTAGELIPTIRSTLNHLTR